MDPKKKFGQNFITDTNLINKIVSSSKINDKNVIEVGPGRGALTKELAKRAKKVIAYEIDKDLMMYLDELVEENDNLEVIYEDFLSIDFESDKKWELIGNLPYYITTPILFKFLENNVYNSATIMVQKEVGERLISKPNSKKYNALSVIVQYLTNVERVVNVSKKLFFPVPKVDSVVIRLEKKNNREIPLEKEPEFLKFVKACFTQKRKTLANNLTESYNQNKETINALLRENQFSESIRAEQLSLGDFINLFNQIV
ncbi:MAG TPA: 16S rRNA (adenine(1518)-N(6)/adenine(1519)-N(6))-dimethyltransferase RsmA [Gallicola sp.]|nr:16S rRNA (adenine(1518)-N(6)/adenine(1519)-N(6))-dimethyltransferase RsmA [Gallicola sp.]